MGSVYPLHFHLGQYFIMGSLLVFIGLLGFFYLTKFTEIHTKGFQLKKLDIQRESLLSTREHRNLSIAHEKSLVSIQDNSVTGGMVAPRAIFYLKQDGAIAQSPARAEFN